MASLKRAYADIILNTAKESAARVLAAERRAFACQQSLFATKDEALATILRLRAIMEAKIREVEKEAFCQSKKIEELELQLGEAEDTIVDLREELKRLREELRMMKYASIHQSSEHRNDVCTLYNNIDTEVSSDTLNEPQNMSTVNYMTTLSQKTSAVDFAGNTVLASNIWRNKEPVQCRNGCTQRIRTLEHNLLTSKGPLREINGFCSSSKNEPLTCANEKLVIACKVDSEKSDKTGILCKDDMKSEGTKQQTGCSKNGEIGQEPGCCGDDQVNFLSRASPRKQRTICNQANTFSNGIYWDKSTSYSNNFNLAFHNKQNECVAPKETSAPLSLVPTGINETTEARIIGADTSAEGKILISNVCSLDTSIDEESMVTKQCSKRITKQCFEKQSLSNCENEILQNSKQISEDVNQRITMNDPLLSKTFSLNNDHPPSEGIQKDSRDYVKVQISSRSKAQNVAESSDKSIMEPEIGVSLLHPDNNNEANGTAHTTTDRFLKYTFQRKRKRGCCPIKNEILFPEKMPTMKTKSADKQNSLQEPSKPVVADLPRKDRRLVQVARQLISLSEKRW